MDALNALLTRVSAGVLVDPAPDGAALDAIFAAGLAAPDHGRLRPFRFICIRGEARSAFGDLLARSLKARQPDIDAAELEREKAKPLRAPLLVAVAAKLQASPKIPAIEQVLAAGAAAENMLVAAHALGFGGNWKTGAPAYDANVKQALGLSAEDSIVGFIYLGSLSRPLPPRPKLDPGPYVSDWSPR
ncbi:MAG TPA: nitroreductase [Candidatus Cybelea sp.]|nr:nitroreductase [Candidatus Cybelea sp.]